MSTSAYLGNGRNWVLFFNDCKLLPYYLYDLKVVYKTDKLNK